MFNFILFTVYNRSEGSNLMAIAIIYPPFTFVRKSICTWLTSYLTGLDSMKQVTLLFVKHKQSLWIQTCQTGGQLFNDTFPYNVTEYYLQ